MYLNPRYFVCAGGAFERTAPELAAQRIAAFGLGLLPQPPVSFPFPVPNSKEESCYFYLTTET